MNHKCKNIETVLYSTLCTYIDVEKNCSQQSKRASVIISRRKHLKVNLYNTENLL